LPEEPELPSSKNKGKIDVGEAVISHGSSLIGKKVKETDFRNRYDAAIVAIHRNGEKLHGKIGEIRINAGDLLLLYAGANFKDRADLYRDIYVISKLQALYKPAKAKVYSLGAIGLLAILLLAVGYFSLFTSLLIIFAVMLGMGMITRQDIKRGLDLSMIGILVFSLALGQATIKSGAADLVASWILGALMPYGMMAILCGLLLLTIVLTSFITNIGAIAIAFPLAHSMAMSTGIDGSPFYLGIAFAASASFMTPIGYQTNLIIYGPGGYTFKDFFKIGIPTTIIYILTVFMGLILLYPAIFL